jgi:hypothetical protein
MSRKSLAEENLQRIAFALRGSLRGAVPLKPHRVGAPAARTGGSEIAINVISFLGRIRQWEPMCTRMKMDRARA